MSNEFESSFESAMSDAMEEAVDTAEETPETEETSENADQPEEVETTEDRAEEKEKGIERVVDVDSYILDEPARANSELREAVLVEQGIDKEFAAYIARMEQEIAASRNTPKPDYLTAIENTSNILGITPDEFLKTAPEWAVSARADGRMQALMDEGLDEEAAKRVAEAEVRAEIAESGSRREQAIKEQDDQLARELDKLYAAYPNLDRNARMPEEVLADYRRGLTPLEAYQKYELSQAAKAKESTKKAAAKSPGSVKSNKPPENNDMASLIVQAMKG